MLVSVYVYLNKMILIESLILNPGNYQSVGEDIQVAYRDALYEYVLENKPRNTSAQVVNKVMFVLLECAYVMYGLDPLRLLTIIYNESGLNPSAVNVNVNGTIDRGLFQQNSKYWESRVSDTVQRRSKDMYMVPDYKFGDPHDPVMNMLVSMYHFCDLHERHKLNKMGDGLYLSNLGVHFVLGTARQAHEAFSNYKANYFNRLTKIRKGVKDRMIKNLILRGVA